MLLEDKYGVALRCDRCSSQMIIASNRMQANLQRMPTGWLQVDAAEHTCPLCSRAELATLRARR
jgi:hypothetical protein